MTTPVDKVEAQSTQPHLKRSVIIMKTYITPLSPEEIRSRLDPFLLAPLSVASRMRAGKAVFELSKLFNLPEFTGTAGPGWFKLSVVPRTKSFVPILYGAFERQENHCRVTLEFGQIFPNLLSLVFFCGFLFAGLDDLIVTKTYPQGWLFICISVGSLVMFQGSLRQNRKLSEKRILELLELKPETKN